MTQPQVGREYVDRVPGRSARMRAKADVRWRYGGAMVKAFFVPALLLVELYKRRPESEQRFLIWLFFVVVGFTLVMGGDIVRHQARAEILFEGMTFSEFIDEMMRVLTFQYSELGTRDAYNTIISYLFGGLLGLPQLYVPFVAAFYGFFFAGSVVIVLRHMAISKLNYVLAAFVIIFIFTMDIRGIQTVRTWTGLWVLTFACLKYYETGQHRYLLLMFVPPFIHFGYWMMAIPAWLVLVFGSKPLLYTSLVVVSSFTAVIPAEPVKQLLGQTDRGAHSTRAYGVEDFDRDRVARFEERLETAPNWYIAYRQSGLQRWAPTFLVLTLFLSGIYSRVMSSFQKRIFSIGVLTLAFSNMTWFLFAMHNRTLTIASVFILAGFLMARFDPETSKKFRNLPPYYQWGLHVSLLFWFLLLLFNISTTLDRLSVFAFFAPFAVFIDPELNMSVKEFLNMLLGRG